MSDPRQLNIKYASLSKQLTDKERSGKRARKLSDLNERQKDLKRYSEGSLSDNEGKRGEILS